MEFSEYCFYLNETLTKVSQHEINKFIELIIKTYEEERMIFIIGNGGSAANASHFAQDLAKGTRNHLDQIKKIKEKLFPEGNLQERFDNLSSIYLKHGSSFIQELLTQLKPLEFNFTLLIEYK